MSAVATTDLPLILVVEDHPEALEQRADLLASLHCATIGSQSEQDAIRAMLDNLVDLVVTDIRLLPARDDKSGVSLARYVKRSYPDIPLIGYSANFADHDLSPAEREIFDEVWSKDVNYLEVDALMQRCRVLAYAHQEGRRALLWELFLKSQVFDMRNLTSSVTLLPDLSEQEETVLRLVSEGLPPREIAGRVGMDEDELYRFVGWVLDELPPEPNGQTIEDVHRRHGSRAASADELLEFERLYGPSRSADDEG